jgi:hypothetical protein
MSFLTIFLNNWFCFFIGTKDIWIAPSILVPYRLKWVSDQICNVFSGIGKQLDSDFRMIYFSLNQFHYWNSLADGS